MVNLPGGDFGWLFEIELVMPVGTFEVFAELLHKNNVQVARTEARTFRLLGWEGCGVRDGEEPRVFDAFPFFNELEMLEVRLNELGGVVDVFVLAEATHTHTGRPKELLFARHKHEARFAPFLPRIQHVIVRDLPIDPTNTNAWDREHFQRDALVRGLREAGAKHTDIVILGDLDEIPRPELVRQVKSCPNIQFPVHLNLAACYYNLVRSAACVCCPEVWMQASSPCGPSCTTRLVQPPPLPTPPLRTLHPLNALLHHSPISTGARPGPGSSPSPWPLWPTSPHQAPSARPWGGRAWPPMTWHV